MIQRITVDLPQRRYEVSVGPGLLDQLGQAVGASGQTVRSAVVICDSTVCGLYGARAVESISSEGIKADLIDFPAGEQNKNLATYGMLMDRLFGLAPAIDRSTVVVGLGGGVSGDLAGFVAATALRGLAVVQCPTSLLADVDSSVGGKTGVDHPTGKNLIGAFHQPRTVVIDVKTLETLPAVEIANGLAECVKHGVIRDVSLLEFIEASAEAIGACDEEVMGELIARNVAIKAAVVAADEREAGQRAHLNFGHTVGHALEVLIGYDKLPHGRAVALGMVAANRIAVNRGLIDAEDERRVAVLLARLSLPIVQGNLPADEVWRIMQHDKKALGGQVRMILPTALGQVEIFDDITAEEVAVATAALNG